MQCEIMGHRVDLDRLNPKIRSVFERRCGGSDFMFRGGHTDYKDHTDRYSDHSDYSDWGDNEGYWSHTPLADVPYPRTDGA